VLAGADEEGIGRPERGEGRVVAPVDRLGRRPVAVRDPVVLPDAAALDVKSHGRDVRVVVVRPAVEVRNDIVPVLQREDLHRGRDAGAGDR
jgi:hypothetical protein